uniref:Uncharacterized protein n=1 Tax=Arundo donax TaxID=35708 RepID=A0A0A8ZQP2_ARUDO
MVQNKETIQVNHIHSSILLNKMYHHTWYLESAILNFHSFWLRSAHKI